ncbi:MAG TPA: hypothetical protein VK698_25110 [Kofleriaceae bacterium]|nr:hypothetical protein [Kofleriaceae bacterium]
MAFNPPLRASEAKDLVRRILQNGFVAFLPHALRELAKDEMTTVDAVNVLRAGTVREAEWENGSWRHRCETRRFCIVFEFESEEECLVVTGWRFKP